MKAILRNMNPDHLLMAKSEPMDPISTKGTMVPAAQICRWNRWRIEDKLTCDKGLVLTITAIGTELVLVSYKDKDHKGEEITREGVWQHFHEEWKKIKGL